MHTQDLGWCSSSGMRSAYRYIGMYISVCLTLVTLVHQRNRLRIRPENEPNESMV